MVLWDRRNADSAGGGEDAERQRAGLRRQANNLKLQENHIYVKGFIRPLLYGTLESFMAAK